MDQRTHRETLEGRTPLINEPLVQRNNIYFDQEKPNLKIWISYANHLLQTPVVVWHNIQKKTSTSKQLS